MVSGRSPRTQLPSVAQVLQFDSLVAGDPVVVAGAAGLARPVRWVHVSELATIAGHLRGREMILTTGIALPDEGPAIERFIDDLAAADVSALVVGFGPHYERELPLAMINAAERHSLPLVALRRSTAFVDVTEDVHARLVDIQVDQLQFSEQVHLTFAELTLEGGSVRDVLREAARLAGRPVVLEDLSHQLIDAADASRERQDVIAEWREQTWRTRTARRTDYDPRTGWLVTTVGARDEDWGRLILMSAAESAVPRSFDADPLRSIQQTLIVLLERAASTLALVRLMARDSATGEHRTHRNLIAGLLSHDRLPGDVAREAAALGVPFDGRHVIGIAMRLHEQGGLDPAERSTAIRRIVGEFTAHGRGSPAEFLVGQVGEDAVGVVVVAQEPAQFPDLQAIATAVADHNSAVAGIAGPAHGAVGARSTLREAFETADVAVAMGLQHRTYRLEDLGLEGLITSMLDDPRVRRFADRQIDRLVQHDAEHGTSLVHALKHYLQAGRNKSLAAKQAYVSRPWLYERLDRAEEILQVDLDDESVCVTLQVALMIHEARLRAQRAQGPEGPLG